MKIHEVIQEFMPCEVCGNRDIHRFYFHVYVHKGSQPFVKCCECEEEYYSTRARKVLTKVENSIRQKTRTNSAIKRGDYSESPPKEYCHPLVKALSGI